MDSCHDVPHQFHADCLDIGKASPCVPCQHIAASRRSTTRADIPILESLNDQKDPESKCQDDFVRSHLNYDTDFLKVAF